MSRLESIALFSNLGLSVFAMILQILQMSRSRT